MFWQQNSVGNRTTFYFLNLIYLLILIYTFFVELGGFQLTNKF